MASSAVVLLSGCVVPLIPVAAPGGPPTPSSAAASDSPTPSATPSSTAYATPQRTPADLERIVTSVAGDDGAPFRLVSGGDESDAYWVGTAYTPLAQFKPDVCAKDLKDTLIPVSKVSRSGVSGEKYGRTFLSIVADPVRAYSQTALSGLTETVRACPHEDITVDGRPATLDFVSIPPPDSVASRVVGLVGTVRVQGQVALRVVKLMALGAGIMVTATRELDYKDQSTAAQMTAALVRDLDAAFVVAGPEPMPTPVAGAPATGT